MLDVLERVFNALPVSLLLVSATWGFLKMASGVNAATRHTVWWVVLAIVLVSPFKPVHVDAPQIELAPLQAAQAAPEPLKIPVDPESTFTPWLTVALLGVSAMLGLRLVIHFARLHWMKWRARKIDATRLGEWKQRALLGRRISLRESARVTSPVACGYALPAIILPQGFVERTEPADLDHVLLHELGHLARRDDWTQLLARVIEAIAWWHPLVLFCLRQIEMEREVSCDDWAIALAVGPQPYAASLTRLVERRMAEEASVLAPGIGGRRSQFARRIERLMNPARNARPRLVFGPVGATLLLLTAITLAATRLPALVEFDETQAARRSETAKAGFLASLAQAGYRDLSVDEIIHLKNHGVSGRYMTEMNDAFKGRLKPAQLVELHQRGIRPAHLRAARQYGEKLTLEQIVRLKDAGVL